MGLGSAELRERTGRWLLAATVVASALALGAVHTQVLAAVAIAAAVATALLWWDAEPLEPRPAATTLVVVGVVLVGWTLVQLVPLPRGMLAGVAGETADVWSRCLAPLREAGPSRASLSLDPTATRVQVLRGVTYLVVYIGALRVARRQEGVAFLERALVVSATLLAAAAVAHPAAGARKVFGLYEPGETYAYDPHHLAPLLNTNHLASYLTIGVVVAVASVIERRDAVPRPVAGVLVGMLAAATVWTLSRGGVASMALGVVLVALLVFGSRRLRRASLAAPAAAFLVVVGAIVVLAVATGDDLRAKVAHGDLSKLDLARNAFGLLRSFGAFGVGRGAFESTFPQIRIGKEYWVNTHPENIVAQWTTEWGLPIGAAALVVIVWALRPKTALARSRAPAGPWAALFAVGAHDLVDFSSEVPGVVIALAVCAATVTGGTGGGQSRRVPSAWTRLEARLRRWSERPRVLASALGLATALAVAATLPFVGDELYNEQRAFRDVGLDRALGRDEFRARAREAMLRHPAEAYFPFVGAVRATVVRDESVLPWAARALERSPVYGRVHLLLARSLYARNPSQARLEYRLACQQDGQLCSVAEGAKLVDGFDDAMDLVPEGPRGALVLTQLVDALAARLPSTTFRLDRELAVRDPSALDPLRRIAAASLADLRNEESWCEGQRAACVADGLEAAHRLRGAAPESCEGHALSAELRVMAGEVDAGFTELDRALDGITERAICARRLVTIAEQTKNNARIDAAIDRLMKLGCDAPQECIDNLLFAATVETRRGGERRALALLKKAAARSPESDAILVEIATRAEAQGFHGEALEAYTKLAQRQPGEPRWTLAVIRTREAVTRGVYERR